VVLPALRSKVKVTYLGGWLGKCPVHGGNSWSMNPDSAHLVCARADDGAAECGKPLEWSECAPRVVEGFVVSHQKGETGRQLFFVHPVSPSGRWSQAHGFVLDMVISVEVE
jgi:hypothetical protein